MPNYIVGFQLLLECVDSLVVTFVARYADAVLVNARLFRLGVRYDFAKLVEDLS